MSFFKEVESAPMDPIFGITTAFNADKREKRVNLGVGSYKTEELKPYLLPSVLEAERRLVDKKIPKEYLPIEGEPTYLRAVKELIFGSQAQPMGVAILQTLGGTGALALGARFLRSFLPGALFVPDPTWDNHARIFGHAGFTVGSYPYYDPAHHRLDLNALLAALRSMPAKSVVVLQASAHNPTGCDPSLDEWHQIATVMQERSLLPFFDLAYQGLASGLEEDLVAVRLFMERKLEFLLASSYSKNFGLYGERIGALSVVTSGDDAAKRVESQLKVLIRGLYSNPPSHGARLIATILTDERLRAQWSGELAAMRERLAKMRRALATRLSHYRQGEFDFLAHQKGMFSLLWLNDAQVTRLRDEYGIYLPKRGRINLAGLNEQNLDYVVSSIVTSYA